VVITAVAAGKLSLILSAEERRLSCWVSHLYVQLQREENWYSKRRVHVLDSLLCLWLGLYRSELKH